MPESSATRSDVTHLIDASQKTFRATGFTPPATIWILHPKPWKPTVGIVDRSATGPFSPSEQQHCDDWLIVQYFKTAVKPVEVALITMSRTNRTTKCEMKVRILYSMTFHAPKRFLNIRNFRLDYACRRFRASEQGPFGGFLRDRVVTVGARYARP
jgi:hypothetical protein